MAVVPEVDLSNYVLSSLVVAVFLLALAGPTSTPAWLFLAIVWTGLGLVLRLEHQRPGGPSA